MPKRHLELEVVEGFLFFLFFFASIDSVRIALYLAIFN